MMEKKIEQKHLVNTKEVCTEIINKKLEKKIDKITSSTHYSDALMKKNRYESYRKRSHCGKKYGEGTRT